MKIKEHDIINETVGVIKTITKSKEIGGGIDTNLYNLISVSFYTVFDFFFHYVLQIRYDRCGTKIERYEITE